MFPRKSAQHPPRPSIFDGLAEKYPQLGGSSPARQRRFRGGRWAAAVLCTAAALFALCSGLGRLGGSGSPAADRWPALSPAGNAPRELPAEESGARQPVPRGLLEGPLPAARQPAKQPSPSPASPLWAKTIQPVTPGREAEPRSGEAAVSVTSWASSRPIVGLSPEIAPPVKVFAPVPRYPPSAWVSGSQGDVRVMATIDERGRVAATEVLAGLSPELDAAAVEALERWRFRPATRQGAPIEVDHILTFRFAR